MNARFFLVTICLALAGACNSSPATDTGGGGTDTGSGGTDSGNGGVDMGSGGTDSGNGGTDSGGSSDDMGTAAVDMSMGTDANTSCNGVLLTVNNYLSWCSVGVNGGSASTGASQTVCVPANTDVALVATAASTAFRLGMNEWHHTDGDTGSGDSGTVSGSMSTAHFMTGASGTACVWICCEFAAGGGCPATNQCP